MKVEIKVPQAGESVTEAMISEWFKDDGDFVEKDELLLEFETDKANMEFPAEESGVLHIDVDAGEVVEVGQVIGYLDTEGEASTSDDSDEDEQSDAEQEHEQDDEQSDAEQEHEQDDEQSDAEQEQEQDHKNNDEEPRLSPAARRIVEEKDLDPNRIEGTGKDGRIIKEDAQKAAKSKDEPAKKSSDKRKSDQKQSESDRAAKVVDLSGSRSQAERGERVVPMSMMRRRIASRLVEAQQNAAILSTFNEVDMTAVMDLRNRYKDAYDKKYGIKLGFMSFFIKAAIEALKDYPEINAMIDGDNLVYRDYYDIGVAVGTQKGLLVPVIRDAHLLSFAEVELQIMEYARKARDGKIALDDLSGGTFTISNGGVYGSLLSTPILNPPQSGILGMHKIEKRPVVINDEVVVRPMMYLALSYDHRIVDGKGAVSFLVKIKECLEDPTRIMLEI